MMKKPRLLYRVCFLLLTVLLLPGCKVITGENANDAYVYPVLPGSEGWKALNSLDEMIAACQVPQNILEAMSTRGLVETAINYPLTGNIVFFNDKLGALNEVLEQSNAMRELLKRPDAAAELFIHYRAMDPAALTENAAGYERLSFPLKFTAAEILLCQEVILDQLTPEQRQALIEECKAKIQAKKQYPDVFTGLLPDTANMLFIKLKQFDK